MTIAPPVPDTSPAPTPGALYRKPQERLAAGTAGVFALVLIGTALVASSQGAGEQNLRIHHLLHTALFCGGGILGVLTGSWLRTHRDERWMPLDRWSGLLLGAALVGPIAAMAVMIPATSDWIDAHPVAHALEHLGLIVLGGLIGLSGRLFSAAFGWLAVILLTAMGLLFAGMAVP